MKRFLLIVVAVIATVSIFAQRTVTGTVIEKDSREAVIQATVSLLKSDSTLVTNAVTNTDGRFSVTAPNDAAYILRITYVGFKTYTRRLTVSDGKAVALGTIAIEPDAIMLKGATVTAHLAKVMSKGDTLIYNADAYRTPEGSVVEELVKRMPGAEVDENGNVKINGKQVTKVRVDGKEFGDTKTALKNLPTSIVERIKSYDEKSDLARITGIDDGNEQTVLDFGLRRGMNRGMMANADLGVGTKDRYSARLFGMYMKDDYRVMGMGNGNNTNDMGFGGMGGRGFGGGRGIGGTGLNAAKSGMLNFNYEKTNLIIAQASVNWNHRDGDSWSRRAVQNFYGTNSFQNSVNQSYSRSNSWSANGRIEWTPDTLWNISFRPNINYTTNDGKGLNSRATFTDDPYDYISYQLVSAAVMQEALKEGGDLSDIAVNFNNDKSLSYGENKSMGGTFQVNRRLGSTGRNITLQLTGNISKNENQQMSSNNVNLYKTTMPFIVKDSQGGDSVIYVSEYQTNRYCLTPTDSWNYSARLSYSEPIARATFLQFSYTFQYRYNKSDNSTFDFSNPPYSSFNFSNSSLSYRDWTGFFGSQYNDPQYEVDSLGQYSEYKNYIHTGEVMLRFVRGSYDFNVGLQVIPQSSDYHQEYLNTRIDTVRNVINWSPTANFRWRFSEQGYLRLEYRGNTSQPSMSDLLVITDNTDPLNVRTGNASLKPSFTQNFSLRYNNYYQSYQRFIFANIRFSTTTNSIANMVTYDPETGGSFSRPENINGNWNTSGNLTFNTAIDSLGFFSFNSTTSGSYNHHVSYVNLDRTATATKNYTKSTNIGERLGLSYRNDWLEVELNGSVNYTHTRNELQPNANLDTWSFAYGVNTTFTLPWGSQVATDLGMNSRRGFTDASMNTNELIWNAQLAHSFLQGKPLTLTLQFNDILGQQSNFSRQISAAARTDNEYNAVNSYAMLHVIYRINLFGTREARQGMRGGFGGPGFGAPGGGGNRRGGGGFGGGRPGGGFGGPRMM